MTTQAKHTPTPWTKEPPKGNLTAWAIESQNQHPVAWVAQTCTDHSVEDANADFIVRACNAHDDLVEACKAMLKWMEFTIPRLKGKCPHCGDKVDAGGLNWGYAIGKARDALVKAGEMDTAERDNLTISR